VWAAPVTWGLLNTISRPIIRRLRPEEAELLRKRDELAAIRATLAERELELQIAEAPRLAREWKPRSPT
jgi:hypothetical protein